MNITAAMPAFLIKFGGCKKAIFFRHEFTGILNVAY
jgi:hypothetical protein